MRLSDKAIKAITPPAKGNRIAYDSEIRGFGLRTTARGVKAFVLNYRFEGRERRYTVGGWPEWSATGARDRARQLKRQVDSGIDPLQAKQERRAAPTFRYVADQYLARHAATKKTGHVDREYLERDVLPDWGSRKAGDIQKADVLEVVERKAKTAPIAGNMLLSIIKGVFNWAIEKDYLAQNPAARVKPPSKKRKRDRWLTEQEIRTVWTELDTAKMAPECRTALRMILVTAQRPGEVLGAEWGELDLSTKLWTIPAAKSKNGEQQSVPLSSLAVELLKPLANTCQTAAERSKPVNGLPAAAGKHLPERWAFPSWYTASHMTVAGLSNAVAVNRAHFGIPHWTPHDLRRTAATQMAKAGVERFLIERILNHADDSITATYERHSYDNEKRKALGTWARKLRQILSGQPAARVVAIG